MNETRTRRWALGTATAALVVALAASPAAGHDTKVNGVSARATKAAAKTYADLVHAAYGTSIASAVEMRTAVEAFLAGPSSVALEAAKQAWLAARVDYGPTEAFRLYDGPIDDPKDGPEGQINAWPLDEAYIDYVDGDPGAEITPDVLVAANEEGGEANISTGWHAIEFLLWGQDDTLGAPGDRPFTDYTVAPNANRRGEYLQALTDLLVNDLERVQAEWDPDDGTYRERFLSNPRRAIRNILRGIGALSSGELAGERMAVAYDTKDQEDEHSCFSDNTNVDVLGNATGVRMVYLAEYPGVRGTSISDLVARVSPRLDESVRAQLDESVALIDAFPASFEELIAAEDDEPGRVALLAAIESIEDQGELIARVATRFGVRITLEV
jgi:putative iron-regulated protein